MVEETPDPPLVFAYYVTGHGLGHATRATEVARHLINTGHEVHMVTEAPDFVYTTEIQSPRLHLRKVLLDCGSVQVDALTVDRLASLEKYSQTAVIPRESILKIEVEWLKSIKADLVVSDIVPVACRAAADAGIRSVCVSNFSGIQEIIVRVKCPIAEDYSHCEFLIRLPGYCPTPVFRDVIDVPLVVRRLHRSREEVRKELGIGDDVKLLILNFGGQPAGWKLKEEYLPPGWKCLVCACSDEQEVPPNFIKLPRDAYTPDLIAASDCMLGKIGYGTFSEALAFKLPFVFVRRDCFNEEPFLRNMLEHYQGGVEMIRRDLLTGCWTPYLECAVSLNPCYDGGTNGVEVAAHLLQDTALGKITASDKPCEARRLRDAMLLGCQLQRVSGRHTSVPDWYNLAENRLSLRTGLPTAEDRLVKSLSEERIEQFEILHGSLQGLSDTTSFLQSLADLVAIYDSEQNAKDQMREQLAAATVFNWEEEIFIARAPGRLDLMGGIADYSGSLVLQRSVPCCCSEEPSKQTESMEHAQARLHTAEKKTYPVLEIVSFRSELSNRGPTFDMDISEFMDGGQPISYEKARKYFAKDPSQKWAAYVAGTILVLMTGLGIRFENSISILVSSAVPEGKGVSSSAAVEVATMSAIAAAHGLNISPQGILPYFAKRHVENHVVGAPCGVMDQMASACGETDKLLAMICQPAEVLGVVDIPSHIQFWGIDSGIRHSVGGSDYGSVRVGTFMGRKIIKSTASSLWKESNPDEVDQDGMELLEAEASLDYLCYMSPHRYESTYVNKLPESISGEEFIEKYVNHNDSVTAIDPKHSYAVRASTRHPIYENFRVKAFKSLLTSSTSGDQLSSLGELMYQCHYSYSACGLGSDGTDRLVELVQEMQHCKVSKSENGTLHGAKITGGGSGGVVCVIGKNCLRSNQQILEIKQRYKDATGFEPYVFEGSSPGAGKFGYLKIRRRSASAQ